MCFWHWEMCAYAEIVMESSFVVFLFFLLCELHRQRLLQRLVEGLRRLALGDPFLFAQTCLQTSPEIFMFHSKRC